MPRNNKAKQYTSGYFPKETTLRLVHSNRSVGLLYGQRSLIIGAADPRNYVGTSEHTTNKQAPFARLARTAQSFETIYFGDTEQVDVLLEHIYTAHRKVRGELKEPAGAYKAGTPYSALDPAMMLWTVVCLADSAQTLYELLVRKLTDGEKEQLWQDYLRFGELFGMSRADAPQTYANYREYMNDRLNSQYLYLTKAAAFMGKLVCFHVPVPFVLRPFMSLANVILRGALPQQVRELYGLPWNPWHRLVFRVCVPIIRFANKVLPYGIMNGSNTAFFRLVSRSEAKRSSNKKAPAMPSNPY